MSALLDQKISRTISRTVARHRLLTEGGSVLLAVSGGADSMALLHLMAELGPRKRLRLGVGHVDHGLRPDSARDAELTAEEARVLGLPVWLERVDISPPTGNGCPNGDLNGNLNGGLEEAARERRYRALEELAAQHRFDRIATGHTMDDQAETVVIRMLRGSGLSGLGGIPVLRRVSAPGWEGAYIRPLIHLEHDDLVKYCQLKSIRFVVDPSNRDFSRLRNRIRHQLMPLLRREYNPGVSATLARTAEVWRLEDELMEKLAAESLEQIGFRSVQEGRRDGEHHHSLRVSCKALGELHPALLSRVIRRLIREVKGDLRRITLEHISAIARLVLESPASRTHSRATLDLPAGLHCLIREGELFLHRGSLPDDDFDWS